VYRLIRIPRAAVLNTGAARLPEGLVDWIFWNSERAGSQDVEFRRDVRRANEGPNVFFSRMCFRAIAEEYAGSR
jgi:hypothetical protein